MTKSKTLVFDIEMSPSSAWVWSTGKQYVSYNNIIAPQKVICISYKWLGTPGITTLTWDNLQDESVMLARFAKIMSEADFCVAHNGKQFDARQINTRMAYYKLPPINMALIEDTLPMTRKKLYLPSYSLAYLAKYFNVGAKLHHSKGHEVWLDVWLKNDRKALKWMAKRCEADVTLLEKVYMRLRAYLDTQVSRAGGKEHHGELTSCPDCGGHLNKDGTRMSTKMKKVQRFRCTKCGKVTLGRQNLLLGK